MTFKFCLFIYTATFIQIVAQKSNDQNIKNMLEGRLYSYSSIEGNFKIRDSFDWDWEQYSND